MCFRSRAAYLRTARTPTLQVEADGLPQPRVMALFGPLRVQAYGALEPASEGLWPGSHELAVLVPSQDAWLDFVAHLAFNIVEQLGFRDCAVRSSEAAFHSAQATVTESVMARTATFQASRYRQQVNVLAVRLLSVASPPVQCQKVF